MIKTKITKNPILILSCFCLAGGFVFWALSGGTSVMPGNLGQAPPSLAGSRVAGKADAPARTTQSQGGGDSYDASTTTLERTKNSIFAGVTSINKEEKTFVWNGKTYPLRTYKPLVLPNDTYANQWWVSTTAMQSAWAVPAGPNQIKTAIIDTGFALKHQEFSGRWAANSGEQGATAQESSSKLNCSGRSLALNKSCNLIDDDEDGIVDNESGATSYENPSRLNCTDQGKTLDKSCNMVDDDGNGYVDDWRGWDFINWDNSPQAGEVNPDGSGTHHGTMTAGVLGATGNNNVGIAGVNWNTQILPIQALNDDEYGDSLTVGESVYYAVDQGADIISISLGSSASDPFMRDAILYALAHDVIVVAASGNDGCDCISYPANYPEVVAVGASDSTGQVSSFSNYGANLDITAPGEDMTVPYWTKANGTSSYASGAAGTSFSTPFVAGLLGLMKSYQPSATWDELTGVLFENSDRRSLTAAGPRSNSFGFGFVKSDKALNRAYQPFQPAVTYDFSGTILGSERIKACDSGVLPGSFIYQLSKNGSIKFTINQYEKRKAENSGWSSSKLFGTCVGLPTDLPDSLRLINLAQEILNRQLKQ